jgi:excisionase family DNA binding protein
MDPTQQQPVTDSVAIVSPYLTASEAAAYLRTTVQGIYSLVKRGRLHPMPGSPGRLLFTRESLDASVRVRRRGK